MTSESAVAYGRAATTRSCARFILDVATISIVRVILRVFSTDLMRPLSSLPLAIYRKGGSHLRLPLLSCVVRLDAATQIRFDVLGQLLLVAQGIAHLWELRFHEFVEAALPVTDLRDVYGVEE